MILFEQWLHTLAKYRHRWAIRDLSGTGEWTFDRLANELESMPTLLRGEWVRVSVSEGVPMFVLRTLQAWRDGGVLCPMETGGETAGDEDVKLAEDVVHIKTTSGSTGEPRQIEFTAAQLQADWRQITEGMKLNPDSPNLSVISVAHSYGFSNLVLPLLLGGMPMIVIRDPLPGTLRQARAIADGQSLTIPAVPAMWRAWHQSGVLDELSISLAISAGAPMSLDLEVAIFERSGLKIHNFYGASECGGIAFDSSQEPRSSALMVGQPLPGVQLSITENGCLKVMADSVGKGYQGVSEESLGDGFFVTSDLATLDSSGVHLEGRLTDTINVAGRKISPQQIESAILCEPEVTHCVVFGIPSADPMRVEEVVACVHLVSGSDVAAFQARVRLKISAWQMPRRWWWTQDLIPDARGKLSRERWKKAYLASHHSSSDPAAEKMGLSLDVEPMMMRES